MKTLKRLVTTKCANYDKNGLCLLKTNEDGCRSCPLFDGDDKRRCLYFEVSLLPEEPKLERKYWEARGVVYENLTKCKQCNELYKRRSNAQKYCDDCGEFNRNLKRSQQNRRNYQRRKAKRAE